MESNTPQQAMPDSPLRLHLPRNLLAQVGRFVLEAVTSGADRRQEEDRTAKTETGQLVRDEENEDEVDR